MPIRYDKLLIVSSFTLLLLGLIMVASASVDEAEIQMGTPLYYFWRQFIYAGIGLSVAAGVLQVPLHLWQRFSIPLLFISIGLLMLVLIPGIGHEVNGSTRWFSAGMINLQPSEFAKLLTINYLADYLARRDREVRATVVGFIKPLAIVWIITSLLLLEPDYGTTVVLFATVLGLLFLAGVQLSHFFWWIIIITIALGVMLLAAPYRLDRLLTFLNPWADPFASGFQLTQSLIAIGRGELFGVGLGNSVQKLAYLPEAHTDFLFAILAEELGLAGVVGIISLFAVIVCGAFMLGARAERAGLIYATYLAYGIGLMVGFQASTNLGVNMGLLPTKGLTLPLMSYGGSSLVVTCCMVALLLRIHREQLRS